MTAAKLAAEALRKARQELVGFYTNSGVVFVASSVLDGIDDALAALSAEQSTVPEDRERLSSARAQGIDALRSIFHRTRLTENVSVPPEVVNAILGYTNSPDLPRASREILGRTVREAWVKWAKQQPNPKPSWLVPWDELGEPDKEVDRQIAEAVLVAAAIRQPVAADVEDVIQRLKQIEEHDWRVSFLAHTSDTAKDAIALLRRLSPHATGEWRPISEAPKDGTPIYVTRDMGEPWGWVLGWSRWVDVRGISGWISCGFSDVPGNLGLGEPTHWQPMPAPPSPKDAGQ